MVTKQKSFRLPDTAWELIGELAKRTEPHPPCQAGNASVVLALLRRIKPQTEREIELYDQIFGPDPSKDTA